MTRPVLVFKTSVHTPADVERLRPALELALSADERWTFDLEDRDRVLRIESEGMTADAIRRLMRLHGHECAELE